MKLAGRRRRGALASPLAGAVSPERALGPRPGAGPPARRPQRGLLRPAPLLGAGILALGAVIALRADSHPLGSAAVLVAAHRLPAGAALRAGDLRPVPIAAAGSLLATLVPASAATRVLGDVLEQPLVAGEPLAAAALGPAVPASFTLTVVAEHALGGALVAGDRISVLATFQTAAGGAVTRMLAGGLLVLAVGQPPSIGDPGQAVIPVTVALPDAGVAARLALANAVAHIDLLRDGSAASASIPSAAAPAVAP